MVSHVAKYFALLSRIYMFWGSDQMTFEGGGGGKFSQCKIFFPTDKQVRYFFQSKSSACYKAYRA